MIALIDLVDGLADAIGRPVGIDDRWHRALAYSSHDEPVDPVRLASIMRRHAPQPACEWVESLGIRTATGFVRVPANPALEMARRLCIPVRFGDALLGFLWIIDAPTPISDAGLAEALEAAREAGVILFRLQRIESASRAHESELVAEVLGVRAGSRVRAARELALAGGIAQVGRYTVAAVSAHALDGVSPAEDVTVQVAAAVEQTRRRATLGEIVSIPVTGHVAVVVAHTSEELVEQRLERVIEAATSALESAHTVVVGVGASKTELGKVNDSYQEALRALRLAIELPHLRPMARWSRLGADRIVMRLLETSDPDGAIPDRLHRLLSAPDSATLVDTLSAYLEHAGNARTTADALFVHRSSLYHRLHRIEKVAGVDLGSGDDRLELHLGLRLLRLSGGHRLLATA
jgi:PucR C-terminal helix-turn-helix domain/GGDEF-like domain